MKNSDSFLVDNALPARQQRSRAADVVVATRAGDAEARPGFIFRHFLHKNAKFSKLATREDPYHLHKTLGILSVASFLFRYAYCYNKYGTLRFDGADATPQDRFLDWMTMAVHTALAFSSIIFRVPRKRINGKPTEGGIGGMFSRLGETVNRGAKVGSRKIMAVAGPSGAASRAKSIEKAVAVFGDKLYKKPFDPHYFKESTTLLIPTSCANWGQGVDYMKAGVKVAGQFTAALQMAAMVFKAARAIAKWYANLGVKSYDREYETDEFFKSSVALVLRRNDGSSSGCLGISGTEISITADCSTPNSHWRSETRQKDDAPAVTRLYHTRETLVSSGAKRGNLMSNIVVEEGVTGG
eukprot:g2267.t1